MGPPSATLYLPDDADLLALANCPGVNINYVFKNVMLAFGHEVYNTSLQMMAEDDPIDVYDIPKDIYKKAIRVSAARIIKHKLLPTDKNRELIWKTKCEYTDGFYIPVPKEIPGGVLSDMKIHCYLSQKKEMVAIRLWNELAGGQKSAFAKTLIRAYLERPIIEPRFFEDLFPMKKTTATGTGALKTREWVSKRPVRKAKKTTGKPAAVSPVITKPQDAVTEIEDPVIDNDTDRMGGETSAKTEVPVLIAPAAEDVPKPETAPSVAEPEAMHPISGNVEHSTDSKGEEQVDAHTDTNTEDTAPDEGFDLFEAFSGFVQ